MAHSRRSTAGRALSALAAASFTLAVVLASLVTAPSVRADGGLTMTAHGLLQGHVRTGSWFAIAVDVQNAGPDVTGELRIAGGSDSRTRFGTAAELATGARKEFLLYAQPPAFGGTMTVQLASGDSVIAETKVQVAVADQTTLVVGIVAENPARLVGEVSLLPNPQGQGAVLVPLTPADLPERVQAWAPLDRLIWQDTDTSTLTTGQVAALRGWVAGGGRLVITGGTAGADSLTGLPDDLLPYRPTGVIDIDPTVLRPVLGGVPDGASTLAAFAGSLAHGRALASSGDRVVAADMPFGSGTITLLGFDPSTSWIAKSDTWDVPLWRRLLPPRATGITALADDSQLVSGAANLPSLALPATSGLLVLLIGYIVLVGPVNYLVLRALDRREWAWVTVPALIVVFAAGSFGIGALTRGSEVIVHEVAIVRGAPGTDQAGVQSWLGIFSPSRATFQVRVPGDTLLSSPMSGDTSSNLGTSALDVLEGDPSRIRDLAVGYGSMRTIRAEGSATGPSIDADLHLQNGQLSGTITNHSDRTLLAPSLVLGSSVQNLSDLAPGASAKINLSVTGSAFQGMQLSDKVVGTLDWSGGTMNEATQRKYIRHSIIDQLTLDPMTGMGWSLPSSSAVLLAWGNDAIVPMTIADQQVRRIADTLYEVPFRFGITGKSVFAGDLLPATVTSVGSTSFSKDPFSLSMGTGTMTMSYRPVPFDGTLTPDSVTVAMTNGGDLSMPGGQPVEARIVTRCEPATAGCAAPVDGLPDFDVLDVRTGTWVQFAHIAAGQPYSLADASRWVNTSTGEVQVRFVNQSQNQIGFQFPVAIVGTVR